MTAVRVSHALFQTEDLARACLEKVKSGSDFGKLARSVSACEQTRDEDGSIGWVGLNDEHLDDLFPYEARTAALEQKPGDIVLTKSTKGWHLVKVDDIMTRMTPKQMQRGKLAGLGVELPSLAEQLAGMKGKQPTYTLETMGCQMK